jgi:hypothetical protein
MTRQVNHVAGNFYEAKNDYGQLFFGPKEKAEAFSKGKYEQPVRTLFEEAGETTFGKYEDAAE